VGDSNHERGLLEILLGKVRSPGMFMAVPAEMGDAVSSGVKGL